MENAHWNVEMEKQTPKMIMSSAMMVISSVLMAAIGIVT
jgi:hypothetical protein